MSLYVCPSVCLCTYLCVCGLDRKHRREGRERAVCLLTTRGRGDALPE